MCVAKKKNFESPASPSKVTLVQKQNRCPTVRISKLTMQKPTKRVVKPRRRILKPGLTANHNTRQFVRHDYHDLSSDNNGAHSALDRQGSDYALHTNDACSPDSTSKEESAKNTSIQLNNGNGDASSSTSQFFADNKDISESGGSKNDNKPKTKKPRKGPRGGVVTPFPERLFAMLNRIEEDGHAGVVSWQPHGRCFVVHKPETFVAHIMLRYFKQTKLTSFQRQLNLYGFNRLTYGKDKGGYYHELFLRGRPNLVKKMLRTKVKGTKIKAASCPDAEPNFYAMPFVYQNETAIKVSCETLRSDSQKNDTAVVKGGQKTETSVLPGPPPTSNPKIRIPSSSPNTSNKCQIPQIHPITPPTKFRASSTSCEPKDKPNHSLQCSDLLPVPKVTVSHSAHQPAASVFPSCKSVSTSQEKQLSCEKHENLPDSSQQPDQAGRFREKKHHALHPLLVNVKCDNITEESLETEKSTCVGTPPIVSSHPSTLPHLPIFTMTRSVSWESELDMNPGESPAILSYLETLFEQRAASATSQTVDYNNRYTGHNKVPGYYAPVAITPEEELHVKSPPDDLFDSIGLPLHFDDNDNGHIALDEGAELGDIFEEIMS